MSKCGVVIEEDWDCSCSEDCFSWGNCCQDIDDQCPELLYWRKIDVKVNRFLPEKANKRVDPLKGKIDNKYLSVSSSVEIEKKQRSSFLK